MLVIVISRFKARMKSHWLNPTRYVHVLDDRGRGREKDPNPGRRFGIPFRFLHRLHLLFLR